MATNDPDQIVVAANGDLYVAALATTAPTDINETFAAAAAAWTKLGYLSEDGVKFIDGKTVTSINVWQSFYAARRIVTAKEASLAFTLAQWNTDSVTLAFGGGEITEPVGGGYQYTPPEAGEIDERSAAVEWVDGVYTYRIIVPRCMVTENVETDLVRTDAAWLPITLGVNGAEGVSPWYLQTDDPAFAPAGS